MAIKLLAIIFISVASIAFAAYSQEDQDDIVDKHNEYRRNVSPTASNMAELKWDADLTNQAQVLADECVFKHSVMSGIGQNLYFSTGTPSVTAPITQWHDEVKGYTYESNACSVNTCGHFTQVVWASTTAVGCGIKHCLPLTIPGVDSKERPDGWLVVCNYKPGGNMKGQRPYESGEQCSQCSGEKTCKNGLCSENEDAHPSKR